MAYLTHDQNLAVAATITASSAASAYPISNIKTDRFSKAWRSNGVLANVDISIDLGSAQKIDLIALFNTNLTSAATVVHAAGTSTSYTEYPGTSMTWREFDQYNLLDSWINYRYHRLRINDAANTDGYIEAAYVGIGLANRLRCNHRYEGGPFPGGLDITHIADNLRVESEFGQPFVDKLQKRKQFAFQFGDMSTADRDIILTWLNALEEEATPMIWIPDPEIYDGWYVRLTTSVRELRRQFHMIGPITVATDGRGKRMVA